MGSTSKKFRKRSAVERVQSLTTLAQYLIGVIQRQEEEIRKLRAKAVVTEKAVFGSPLIDPPEVL